MATRAEIDERIRAQSVDIGNLGALGRTLSADSQGQQSASTGLLGRNFRAVSTDSAQGGRKRTASIAASAVRSRVNSVSSTIQEAARSLFGFKAVGEDFWVTYLSGQELQLDLPLDKGNRENSERRPTGPIEHMEWTLPIPASFAEISPELWEDQQTAGILLVYTVWITILGRMARSTEFVTAFGADPTLDTELLPSQTVPMVVSTANPDGVPYTAFYSFSLLAQEMKKLQLAIERIGLVKYEVLLRALGLNESDQTSHPLVQTAFMVGSHLSGNEELLKAMRVTSSDGAPLALQLRMKPPTGPSTQNMSLQLLYWHDVVSVESANSLRSQLNTLFAALASKPGRVHAPLQEISSLTHVQEKALIRQSDKTDYVEFKPGQIHAKFMEQAKLNGSALALLDCKEDGVEDSYTYQRFNEMASALAETLTREYNVGLDSMIPLLFDRGIRMVVAIYGTLMAGGAYVPLEPHYPAARILGIVEQVLPPVALTVAAHGDKLHPTKLGSTDVTWPVLGLGAIGQTGPVELLKLATFPSKAPAPPTGPDAAAKREAGGGLVYVFFTSGSTGKPKGVMCEHAGLRHRVEWMQRYYQLDPGEATILKHAYTFGISEWEMFWPMAVGGTLVVPKPGGEKDPEYIFSLCANHPVTVMYMVPSMLNMLLDYIQAEEKDPVSAGFHLRQVITCGEPLQEETIQNHFRLLFESELDNLYGPTEGSMTVWRCPRGQRIPQVPIGKPIDGIRAYALAGEAMRLAEVNTPGEIYFAGQFIARGYLGLPGQTAQVFLKDSVLPETYPNERMYKTGDLACWKPDGNLTFLGRADNQIKLRGFRIEIGEIEAVVRGAAGVKDAVVVLSGEGESKFLAAYVAPATVDLDTLRATCNSKLPHYMVPSTFMKLPQMPVTDRGKLDKKALPKAQLEASAVKSAGAIVPPRTPLEMTIVAIFAEVLGKDPGTIGIESDFVSIGGNSVLAGKVTSRLRKALNLPLPGTSLYKRPTPSQMAQLAMELREQLGISEAEEGDNGRDEEGPPQTMEERYKGMSSTRCAAIFLTSMMPVFEFFAQLSGLLGFIEVVVLKYLSEKYDFTDPMIFGSFLFLVSFLIMPTMILFDIFIALLFKCLFIGRLKEGNHPVFSVSYFRWLYSMKLMQSVVKDFQSYFIGTPALVGLYRLFGARIGRGVVLNTKEVIFEPELLTIEDNVLVDDNSKITCHSVGDGMLMLHPVHIGKGTRIRQYASVGRGAYLPPASELVSTSCFVGYGGKPEGFVTGGKLAVLRNGRDGRPKQQPWLRLFIGVPFLFTIDAMANALEYIFALWIVDLDYVPYMLIMAWGGEHVHRFAVVTLTILAKWLLVGRVKPGSRANETAWEGLCTWIVDTLLRREAFHEAMEGFINTEILRLVFVLLGAKIGRRANMDMITCHMPDLLSIGDYMLFGSKVGIICEDEERRKAVQICRGANVLDNCVLCPGVTVGQRAVLGTNTLAAPGQYFPPDTINTGNKGGQAVFLRKKGKGTAQSEALEAEANRRLDSPLIWTLFNIGLIAMAFFEPLFRAVKTMPFIVACMLPFSTTVIVIITVVLMLLEEFIEAALLFVLKWAVIGKFKERDVVFFGIDHFLWMCWLMVSSTFNHLDGFHGTALYSQFLRAMGATVGKDCTLFGFTLEFDLLFIGDRVNVGQDCDNTCHTVENMVLKMVPVRLGTGSTMQRHSFVMPGAELAPGAVLFEESQVLKGETVPQDDVWAGNPAEPMRAQARSKLWRVPRLQATDVPTIKIDPGAKLGLAEPLLKA
eukprot:TRINITY_DN14818_c0_g1_i1.p1 TRINITY_DN14818_c0_g1~~TRINITY_DN14818_c0_g1_i1.p1  ORF type:complete len:1772 (-),score=385.57 TRINITY_DN14818_c0_g1_i1:42-5357(-)